MLASRTTPSRTWYVLVFRLLALAAIAYAVVVGAIFLLQGRLLFHPQAVASDFRYTFGGSYAERNEVVDGISVNSLRFNVNDSHGLILYFHGNAGSMKDWGVTAEELARRMHHDVWIMDYPGFGKSAGRITSEAQLHSLAKHFYEEALKEHPEGVVVFGRSIGTGLAARLAAENHVKALILESPYYGMRDLANNALPWIPGFILRYPLPSYQWIPKVTSPVLMIHGDEDEMIPVAQARRLSALASSAAYVEIPGGHHNDLADFKLYWKSLDQFLEH